MTENDVAGTGLAETLERLAAEAGIKIEQRGSGRTILVLHGGGGPFTVAAFAQELARHHHVITPTHAGFAGTVRPPDVRSMKDLARGYVTLLERAGAKDVLVVGFSMGGGIAAEMAASGFSGIAGVVLVNGVGIAVPGHPVLDVLSIPPAELASYSYHEPERFRIDPAKLTEQQLAGMRANFAALAVYASSMQNPDLRDRLATVQTPALIVWGESDRVVSLDYGRAFAAAFPKGRFAPIAACGHMPQIEQPQRLLELVTTFETTLS